MRDTLIAIDAGTTGVTSILFDRSLRVLARSYREFEQLFPQPGWVEHAANAILGAVDATLADLLADPRGARVAAVGITNQRETVFALDRAERRPLGTGIVWQDRRTARRCEELRAAGVGDLLRRRTGLLVDPYFSATKIEWMLANRPGVRERASQGRIRFCTVDALIVEHLTGGASCATDPTNASRTLLFDLDARAWSGELCELFGVRTEWLPELRSSSASFGAVAADGAAKRLFGVPIHGVVGDQQAALFGQGCFDAGTSKNTYGTGCFLLLNTGDARRDSRSGLLTTIAVDRRGEPCYALEGSVFAGGAVVQWLRDQAGFLERAGDSEAIARSVEDTGGVFLVPAFAGLGAPYWDAGARAAILGMTRGTSSAHIVRAGLEAIAYQCADVVEVFRAESGLAIDTLRVDGGASANDFLMQTQADLAGLEVVRSADVEATARGAALLAGFGAGVIEDPTALDALGGAVDRFRPRIDASERGRRMAAWREAVARVRTAGGTEARRS